MKFSVLKKKYPDIRKAEVTKLSKDASIYYKELLKRIFGNNVKIEESNGNPLATLDEDSDWEGYNNEIGHIYICPRFIEVIFGKERANVLLFDSENQKIPLTLFKKFILNSKLKTITGDAYTYKVRDNKIVDYDDNKATASTERKFKFKDGSIITASTVEEAKKQHKVMAAEKNPQMKIIADKLKELGLTIQKKSNGHLYARSKSYFKDSYYEEKKGLWVEITDFEDGDYEYDLEICRYEEEGVDCIVSFGEQTKSLDKMFAAIKSKCEEFEIICKHRNKVYELEQKFTRKA